MGYSECFTEKFFDWKVFATAKFLVTTITAKKSTFAVFNSRRLSFLAKNFLAENFLAKNFLAKNFLANNFLTKNFLVKKFLVKNFLVKKFLVKNFLVKNFFLKNCEERRMCLTK
jgi:hypothetical protein